MNIRNRILIYLFAIVGVLSALTYSCKKSDDTNPPAGNTVTDIDGNVYHTVTIGTQTWMLENLKTTLYRNADIIPNVIDVNKWSSLTTGALCNYDNDTAKGTKYGKLYNWFALVDSRNIAPDGWHVPTDDEWTTLENYMDANPGTSGSVAKALAAKTNWAFSNSAGAIGNDPTNNNSSGFSALPGGSRGQGGAYYSVGSIGNWWSSTESHTGSALTRYLDYESHNMYRNGNGFTTGCGFSVRCVKD